MKAWLSPVRIVVIFLSLMSAFAVFFWSYLKFDELFLFGRNMALFMVGSWTPYLLLLKLGKIRPTRWEHKAITGMIVFLLFDILTPWWVFAVLGVVTEVVQRFVRSMFGPIFNPASLGVLAVAVATGYLPTWWGTNFGPRFFEFMSLAFIFTLIIMGYVVYKYRKLPLVISSLVGVLLFSSLFLTVSPAFLLLDGTLLFFITVMVVEPKTSPVILREQIVFGLLLAALVVLGMSRYWVEPYVIALLVCNGLYAGYRNGVLRKLKLLTNKS